MGAAGVGYGVGDVLCFAGVGCTSDGTLQDESKLGWVVCGVAFFSVIHDAA